MPSHSLDDAPVDDVTSRAQPVTNPRHQTPPDPDKVRKVHRTFGLLFEPSAPLTFYLLIPYTSSSDPTPDSACLWTSAPLCPIIPFILLPYLPYSWLPACIRFLVPDSDQTSYMDLLL